MLKPQRGGSLLLATAGGRYWHTQLSRSATEREFQVILSTSALNATSINNESWRQLQLTNGERVNRYESKCIFQVSLTSMTTSNKCLNSVNWCGVNFEFSILKW